MYESPTKIIRAIVPNPLVSFGLVARVAGFLYLLGIILPNLSDRVGFSAYTSWYNEDPLPLQAPFDFDLIVISGFGVVAGPAETAEAEGIVIGLLDFVLVPFFTLTFPVLGIVLTAGIFILGGAFLLGHKTYSNHLTLGFFILFSFYIILFSMNAATLHARFGLYSVSVATALMLFVTIDRMHRIGLVSSNGYRHPHTYERDKPKVKKPLSTRLIYRMFRRVSSETPTTHESDGTDENSSSGGVKKDEQDGGITYAGSATRRGTDKDS